jgi:hypothetical protein
MFLYALRRLLSRTEEGRYMQPGMVGWKLKLATICCWAQICRSLMRRTSFKEVCVYLVWKMGLFSRLNLAEL